MTKSGVTVSWSSIERQFDAETGDSYVLLVVKIPGIKGSPAGLVADVNAAIDDANERLQRVEDYEGVHAPPAIPSPIGPIVRPNSVRTKDEFRDWLDSVARSLGSRGRRGKITAAPKAHLSPEFQYGYLRDPRPTAYCAYTLLDPLPPHGSMTWGVDPHPTRELASGFARWGRLPNAALHFSVRATTVLLDNDADVGAELQHAINATGQSSATFLAADPYASRSVCLSFGGEASFQAGEERTHWRAHVEAVRETLLWHPQALDAAYIRLGYGWANTWMALAIRGLTPPYVEEVDLRMNRPLWNRYLPDANAIQLVTDAHLAKANDLSDWQITQVAEQRYLLEARDIAPWFNHPRRKHGDHQYIALPPAEVVAKARQDFGDMIMTPAAIASEADGWSRGQPMRVRAD